MPGLFVWPIVEHLLLWRVGIPSEHLAASLTCGHQSQVAAQQMCQAHFPHAYAEWQRQQLPTATCTHGCCVQLADRTTLGMHADLPPLLHMPASAAAHCLCSLPQRACLAAPHTPPVQLAVGFSVPFRVRESAQSQSAQVSLGRICHACVQLWCNKGALGYVGMPCDCAVIRSVVCDEVAMQMASGLIENNVRTTNRHAP